MYLTLLTISKSYPANFNMLMLMREPHKYMAVTVCHNIVLKMV